MKVIIEIESEDGLKSHSAYSGDYYELHNQDWNDLIRYSLDDYSPNK